MYTIQIRLETAREWHTVETAQDYAAASESAVWYWGDFTARILDHYGAIVRVIKPSHGSGKFAHIDTPRGKITVYRPNGYRTYAYTQRRENLIRRALNNRALQG